MHVLNSDWCSPHTESCWVIVLLLYSDLGLGQTQDDSIVGLRQNKQTQSTMAVSGNLSSSNPDLAQGQQRIIDYSTQPPGKYAYRIFKCMVKM